MSETPQERQEKARMRRRWLTLGELLAIAAVAISGLTLWNSYSERTHAESERQGAESKAAKRAGLLLLKATPDADGRVLTLLPQGDDQAVQGQTIRLPSAFGLTPVETTGDARIERDWFDAALVKARKDGGLKTETSGDARLPVLVVTRFLTGGEAHVDRAVYQIGYAAAGGGLFSGTRIRLRGMSRSEGVGSDAAGQKRVDALWRAAVPKSE